jgi:hypothetical protein
VWIRLGLGAAIALTLAACGGQRPAASASCHSTPPGAEALYANADVAIAWPAGLPEGGELESARFGGELPWFAKTGLFVRGPGTVVVRVAPAQHDVVAIRGWGGDEPRTDALVERPEACAGDWTAYPGGLAFAGRQCVRLRIEGPGDQTGSLLIGLRRDCSR